MPEGQECSKQQIGFTEGILTLQHLESPGSLSDANFEPHLAKKSYPLVNFIHNTDFFSFKLHASLQSAALIKTVL